MQLKPYWLYCLKIFFDKADKKQKLIKISSSDVFIKAKSIFPKEFHENFTNRFPSICSAMRSVYDEAYGDEMINNIISSTYKIGYKLPRIKPIDNKDIINITHATMNGCSSTSTYLPASIVNAFLYFGYHGSYGLYSLNVIINECGQFRPVFLYSTYGNGPNHAWVCDGYNLVECEILANGGSIFKDYLHMNWGWYGDCDGWYLELSTWYTNRIDFSSNYTSYILAYH